MRLEPIATAPTDGTVVRVTDGVREAFAYFSDGWHRVKNLGDTDDGPIWEGANLLDFAPTHWRR